jgi:endonuclease/exonuclease/phosphatase family metal-dependent hydrolase
MVGDDVSTLGRPVLHNKIETKNNLYSILNVHGFWHPGPGIDSPETLIQCENIAKLLNSIKGRKILCGDMNLFPDTKSIELIEEAGMRDLTKEYNIKSTRTSYFRLKETVADYIFVSDGVTVKDFKVLPDEVSDHSPLLLEFS